MLGFDLALLIFFLSNVTRCRKMRDSWGFVYGICRAGGHTEAGLCLRISGEVGMRRGLQRVGNYISEKTAGVSTSTVLHRNRCKLRYREREAIKMPSMSTPHTAPDRNPKNRAQQHTYSRLENIPRRPFPAADDPPTTPAPNRNIHRRHTTAPSSETDSRAGDTSRRRSSPSRALRRRC